MSSKKPKAVKKEAEADVDVDADAGTEIIKKDKKSKKDTVVVKKKVKTVAFDLDDDDTIDDVSAAITGAAKKAQAQVQVQAKAQTKAKTKESKDVGLDDLINMSQFDIPKQKTVSKVKEKDIVINMDCDSQEEIIRKLVLTVQKLKAELDEYKLYAEGTFCTSSVFNRVTDELTDRITTLENP
jgi:hypothetical protein